ncbi:hypothetical protein OsI_37005 [Oryza sativa Indica Group]|uniref:Uncharacterized protein n=1 Tax=Oryza sativa subsp. indica TaxID=39946 RepID=B8BII9_ORYSI|nr:hypothetical protein OsI_37005 [Oryza sativa Indica Group]
MTAAMLLKSSGHAGSHYPVTGSNEAVAVGLAPHMTPIRRSDRSNSETALGIASADDDSLLKAMKRKAAINLDDQFAPYGARPALLASPQVNRSRCLKTVEDLPFLSSYLLVEGCEGLERISNLPQVRELFVNRCLNLRHVEELGGLEQLLLDEGMQEISQLWIPGLQEQHRQLHGDEHELEVIEWL